MSTKKIQDKVNDPATKAKNDQAKTAKAADKPKHKPRTEEQKKARRERDAKRREAMKAEKKPAVKKADASGSKKVSVKFTIEIGGINKDVADLYGNIMSRIIDVTSNEVKNLLNAMDDVVSEAKKR